MSTFFEKLTGSPRRAPAPDPVDMDNQKEEARAHRPLRYGTPESHRQKAMRISVDTSESVPASAPEETPEEEGELTVDIYHKDDAIVIQSTVAGVKPENLDVSITNDSVTIRGKRDREEEVQEDNYYYKELFWGTFSRSVILPEEIEEDEAEASLRHGLLSIRLPKKRHGVVQKLKVKLT